MSNYPPDMYWHDFIRLGIEPEPTPEMDQGEELDNDDNYEYNSDDE